MNTPLDYAVEFLLDILVLTVKKGFWASEECRVFPNQIYAKIFFPGPGRFGSSRNPLNMLTLAIEGLCYWARKKPRIIFFGAAPRLVSFFVLVRKLNLFPETKFISAGASYLTDDIAKQIEKMYVYSRSEIGTHDPGLREKYEFIPLPANGNFDDLQPPSGETYIFSGGGAGRDFATLIESVRGLDLKLKIVTFSPQKLAYTGVVPENCEILWRMPLQSFLNLMAGAKFVVVPLKKGDTPHGHTTVVQAIRMGKAVITTRHASINDYVTDGENGLCVTPGEIEEYRTTIQKLCDSPELLHRFEHNAQLKAIDLTYDVFAERLVYLCRQVLKV